MGIQHLNRFMRQNCSNSIQTTRLAELSGRVIVIDTSIYLYRFKGDDTLLENMYTMISLFRYHNIIPLFIFEGKAGVEKSALIRKRKDDKDSAETEYTQLSLKLEEMDESHRKNSLKKTLTKLKKRFVRVSYNDIIDVKNLMDAFGVTYWDAKGEADEVCAKLVVKKIAYACLSEDMDLFVYGCPRVIRYLSIVNEKCILYDFNEILEELHLTFDEFKDICILAGTDYTSITDSPLTLSRTLKYFTKFKKSGENNFYEWIENNTDAVKNIYQLYNIQGLFMLDKTVLPRGKIQIKNREINRKEIQEIMKKEGFIFL